MLAKRMVLTLLFVAMAVPAHADDASKRKTAEEIIEVTNLKDSTEKMQQQTARAMGNTLLTRMRQKYTCLPNSFVDDFANISLKYVKFEAIKGTVIEFYINNFTEEELQQILAFRKSPVGQKELKEMPLMVEKMIPVANQIMAEHKADTQADMKTLLSKYIDDSGQCIKDNSKPLNK